MFQLRPFLLLPIAIILLCYTSAYGQVNFSLEPSIGRLYGHTLYNISGYGFFSGYGNADWSSELKWPLNNTLAGISLNVTDNKMIDIDLSARTSIDNDSGKMKDSDYVDTTLIIYSESDSDTEVFELDIKAKLYTKKEKTYLIDLLAGFKYQELSFEASNLVQDDISGSHVIVSGLVGTYDVDYYIPAVGVGFRSLEGSKAAWNIASYLGYVIVRDTDDHILRSKESTGKSTGVSFTLAGESSYDISERTFITLSGEFTYIYAEGEQKQTWYETTSEAVKGTTFNEIPLEIESSQGMINLGLGIRF